MLPVSLSAVCPLARSGEKRAIVLVERRGEDAIRRIECLLDTISMMDVNVNVKDPRVMSAYALVPQEGEG